MSRRRKPKPNVGHTTAARKRIAGNRKKRTSSTPNMYRPASFRGLAHRRAKP